WICSSHHSVSVLGYICAFLFAYIWWWRLHEKTWGGWSVESLSSELMGTITSVQGQCPSPPGAGSRCAPTRLQEPREPQKSWDTTQAQEPGAALAINPRA
ncbi:hypothetical protein INR49_016512, partial [Caranx melampygus]